MDWLQLLFGSGDCLMADFGLAATIISAVVAAATAATSAGMAAKSAKDARRKEEKNKAEIEEEKRRRENLFNLRYHQDMTDRTEVQGMLRELREQQDAQRSQNEARGAVMGDTKEQQLAEQQGLNKSMADSMAEMTRNASALKDGYLDNYENSLSDYYNKTREHNSRMSEIEMNRSNQWAQTATNAVNAMANSAVAAAGMADAGAAGMPGKKDLPMGGLQQSTPSGKDIQYQTPATGKDAMYQDVVYEKYPSSVGYPNPYRISFIDRRP